MGIMCGFASGLALALALALAPALTLAGGTSSSAAAPAASASPSSLHGIVVHLRSHGQRLAFLLDRDEPEFGLPVAHTFFRKHFPGKDATGRLMHEGLGAWLVLALLREPAFRAQVQQILDVGGLQKVHLFLVLTDGAGTLYRGERVLVPLPGGRVSVMMSGVEDRDMAVLARRLGTTTAAIAEHDPERFEVFPHVLYDDGRRGHSIHVGERGMMRACRGDVTTVRAMLLHELAHTADFSKRDRVPDEDRRHGPWKVLHPTVALAEGWADYWAMQTPGIMQRMLAEKPPERLQKLGAGVMLRCSPVVGGILTDLAALRPGRQAVHDAVRAAWRRRNPVLGDVLAAYVRARPGMTMPVAEILARRTCGQGTPVHFLLRARGAADPSGI